MTNCVAVVSNKIGFLRRLFPKSREFPTLYDPKKRGVVNLFITTNFIKVSVLFHITLER